jgi:hypothetical protein
MEQYFIIRNDDETCLYIFLMFRVSYGTHQRFLIYLLFSECWVHLVQSHSLVHHQYTKLLKKAVEFCEIGHSLATWNNDVDTAIEYELMIVPTGYLEV